MNTTLGQFDENMARAESALKSLSAILAAHKGQNRDLLHWGHVGDVGRIATALETLVDAERYEVVA